MSATRSAALAVLPLLGLIALSGCTAAPPVVDETYASDPDPSETPQAALTPNPIEPDTTLIVSATATASNGAQLDLQLQVHRSVPWDDVANQTLPAALLEDCASLYTGALFAEQQWSFTRVNLTAIPTSGSTAEWPADATIVVRPSAEFVPIAGRGDFVAAGTAATPLCLRDRYLTGPGRAGLAFGLPQDGVELIDWASHRFGLVVEAATLSDCRIEVTALGTQSGAGAGSWTTTTDDLTCVAGPESETSVH